MTTRTQRAEAYGAAILELCVEVGGTITGEHGVGIEKINQMCVQFRTGELQTFHAVKKVFDEFGLLNPGKAVPTLQRCAEFGAMHVHRGQEKFPDLPRSNRLPQRTQRHREQQHKHGVGIAASVISAPLHVFLCVLCVLCG